MQQRGRVTIPTDVDVVPETLTLMERWGADAIRDCDGTDYPEELRAVDAKVYSTYYTTRKDNTWAKAHPEEIQQMYIMTPFYTAVDGDLQIHLMTHLYPDMLKVNNRDDITRWWEVIDRTTGAVVSTSQWSYDETTGDVTIHKPEAFHSYTVSFLAYIMWDPVHMYNAVTNGWKDVEKQITFDVRQPKTHTYSMERLRRFIAEHPYVDVIRYTTFFHQFTLIFDELAREKYVDWYGYSASVSPYILEQFEKEVGYRFRPEFIIDQGYMNNTYRVPSKEFQDFQAFQRREVAKLAKEMVDITHACGKEAMMFLGDHWIGMEPFMEEFQTIGLDAVVGSVGNGATLRLISDIEGVRYTEGRFLPYFFPDTFHEGGDPTREAKVNWVTARRAILRKPIDRIGYGGYLKLATQFPDFIDYVESVLTTEINSTTDNPTVFPEEDMVVSAGNFHGQPIALAMDFLAIALAELGNISERRTYKLISGARELPKFLVANPGLNSGFMIPQYTAASIVSQSKGLCMPASVDSIPSSQGQEDHVSMGSNAATKLWRVVCNTERVLAIELFNAAQAIEFRRPAHTSPELERMLADYRKEVPFIDNDEVMYPHIEASVRFLRGL